MGDYHFLRHNLFDQRSSTPKTGRMPGQHKLFNANESAILEHSHSGSDGGGQQEIVVQQQITYKRKLFCSDGAQEAVENYVPSAKRMASSPQKTAIKSQSLERPLKNTDMVVPKSFPAPQACDLPEDPPNQRWSPGQVEDFFAAARECGADCDAIAQKMKVSLWRKFGRHAKAKQVGDIQKYLQRIVLVVARIVEVTDSGEGFQTYAVVNYGAWNKHFGARGCSGLGQPVPVQKESFKVLFTSGETKVSSRRKSGSVELNHEPGHCIRVKTPDCAALRRVHCLGDVANVPSTVTLRLRPRMAPTWANVRRSGKYPVLDIFISRTRTLKHLTDFLCLYWFIDRKVKKFYNSEDPILTLLVPVSSPLKWPQIMPDFDVLLKRRSFCWHSYLSYQKTTGSQRLLRDRLVSPTKENHRRGKAAVDYFDDDACFYGDDESEEEDVTAVSKSPVQRVFDPCEVYGDYFHGNRIRFTSSNPQHLRTSVAEMYMIAGGSGELLFEYDWIVPDQEILNELPLESLGSTELSDLFYEKLQITNPRKTEQPPVQPLATPIDTSQKPPSPRKSPESCTGRRRNRRHQRLSTAPIAGDCGVENVPTNPASAASSAKNFGPEIVIDSEICGTTGETLSEFIVPNHSTPQTVSSVTAYPLDSYSSVLSAGEQQVHVLEEIPRELSQSHLFGAAQFQNLETIPQNASSINNGMVYLNVNGVYYHIAATNPAIVQPQNIIQQGYVINSQHLQQQNFLMNGLGQIQSLGQAFVLNRCVPIATDPNLRIAAQSPSPIAPKPDLPIPIQFNSLVPVSSVKRSSSVTRPKSASSRSAAKALPLR